MRQLACGFPAAELRAMARGCAESFGGAGGRIGTGAPVPDPSVAPVPSATLVDDPTAPLLADVVRVHAVVRDAAGTLALLYGPGVVLVCTVGGATPYKAGGGLGDPGLPDWLPGPVSVDLRGGVGGDGEYVLGGRVTKTVAKVVVVHGSHTVTVPVTNGAYLARLTTPDAGDAPGTGVRAYDAGGRLVGETSGTSLDECYRTPEGQKIGGDRTDPGQRCQPATPWR